MRALRLSIAAITLCKLVGCAPDVEMGVTAQAASGVRTICVATDGSDSDDGFCGLSGPLFSIPARPVKTLARVQERLEEIYGSAANLDRDVEVRIEPGTYYYQSVTWSFVNANHQISFVSSGGTNRPVFDACLGSSTLLCKSGAWFRLSPVPNGPSNINFEYIAVQRYGAGIVFHGYPNYYSENNRVYGCVFDRIGTKYNERVSSATAAVNLKNADYTEVANNHFINIENSEAPSYGPGAMHAVYLSDGASNNLIRGNQFRTVSGVPVKTRNAANYNIVKDNNFVDVHEAAFLDAPSSGECLSGGNELRDNDIEDTYDGIQYNAPPFADDATLDGDNGSGCPTPPQPRLSCSGNLPPDGGGDGICQ